MATYSIDDSMGRRIAGPIRDKTSARLVAQGEANDRDEAVWLYRDSEGAQAYEAEQILPTVLDSAVRP